MQIYKRFHFTCENIEYNLINSAFTVEYPQPTSVSKRYKRSKAQNVGIHLLNWIVRDLLLIKLLRYAKFSFSLEVVSPKMYKFLVEKYQFSIFAYEFNIWVKILLNVADR